MNKDLFKDLKLPPGVRIVCDPPLNWDMATDAEINLECDSSVIELHYSPDSDEWSVEIHDGATLDEVKKAAIEITGILEAGGITVSDLNDENN